MMVGDNLYDDIIQSQEATDRKIGGILINNGGTIRTKGYDFYIAPNLSDVPEIVKDYFHI